MDKEKSAGKYPVYKSSNVEETWQIAYHGTVSEQ